MTKKAAQILAEWSSALEWEDVPAELRSTTGLRVLDTLGLILAASETPAAAAVHAVVRNQGISAETAFMPRGQRSSAAAAALGHGIMAHFHDFDDTFPDSVVHPGSIVICTAMAVGEAVGAEAPDIAAAITAGYEIAARLGAAAGRKFHRRGMHATGMVGPFAAASTAARLMRLNGEDSASALGLAGSMSSGLMAFLNDGSWSKSLHVGWSSHGGILAAQLAAQGFKGPAGILDARYNLYDALLAGETVDQDMLAQNLGTDWHGAKALFKLFPCAHVIQPYIEAAIEIKSELNLEIGDIAAGTCRIAPWAAQIVAVPRNAKVRPNSETAAAASLPWQLAVALRDGDVTLEALESGSRSDPVLLDVADRLTHAEDQRLGSGFDGALSLELRDGRTVERTVAPSRLDKEKLVRKFRVNATRAASAAAAARLEHLVLDEELPDFAGIFELLGTDLTGSG